MAKSTRLKLNNLTKRLKAIKAKDIMTKEVITTTEDVTLADLAELMIDARISGLPVVRNKNKVVGVITADDLFAIMDMIKSGDVVENASIAVSNPKVKFAMSSEVIKVNSNTTLNEIIAVMKYKNVLTLPVFQGNKMVGVIGRHNVFKSFYSEVKKLH